MACKQTGSVEQDDRLRLTETLHWIKPSDTICPASVAVMLALCPEQMSAIANTTAAAKTNFQLLEFKPMHSK